MWKTIIPAVLLFSTFASAAEPPSARRLLAADYSTHRIAIISADGKVEWEHKVDSIHDLHFLTDGHVLFQETWTHLLEIDPATNKVVWEYDSSKLNGNGGKPVEVHAFQRLADGVTMIAESGPGRIIEVDKSGKLLKEIKLKVANPDPHRDTRLVRKLENGNYLVCHEGEGSVREYDGEGNVVWDFPVPLFDKQPAGGHGPEAWGNQTFGAIRLANGNTLVATGNGHSVLEVTPAKVIVWKIEQNELPGITLAWVTTLQELPNGNIVIGNCHATDKNPQIVEVTKEKNVVWTFKDFKLFGDALSNSQIIVDGVSTR